jgi:hypothetical protein
MGRNGYEPIPEVKEKGDASLSINFSAQDRYPEANVEEAELLGLLDRVIDEATIQVQLPQLKVEDVHISTTCRVFICALRIPTFISLLMATLGCWIAMDTTVPGVGSIAIIRPYFPYIAAMLGFLASIPPMQKRFRQQATTVESLIHMTRPVTITSVQNVVLSVASKIDLVNMRLNLVVDAMRPKFQRALAAKAELKAMDPNIIIPDPGQVERQLEGAKEEIDESIKFVEMDFPVTPWIPTHLRTSKSFQQRASSKILFLCLILQFAGVSLVSMYYPVVVVAEPQSGSFHSVWSEVFHKVRKKKMLGEHTNLVEDIGYSVSEAWPVPLVFVVVVYVMVLLQLMVVFWLTTANATAAIVNQVRGSVSVETNHVLRQHGIIFLCQDILETRMGRVRIGLLKMIKQVYKIDMLMSLTSCATPSPTKSLPKNSSPASPNKIAAFFRTHSSSPSPSPCPSPTKSANKSPPPIPSLPFPKSDK